MLLSPDARLDFTDIDLDTLRHWGKEQRDRYLARVERAIAGLAYYPEIGTRREGIVSGCRVHPVARHVIYYRFTDDAVEVLRILHERVDPTSHLQP